MKISAKGLELIKHFESLHDGDLTQIGLQPKMDPIGIWTVGYGRALKDENGNYLRGEKDKKQAYEMFPDLSEKLALMMLDEDCDVREERLNSLRLPLNQNQFDSLISFIYNEGFYNFLESTLLKRIKLSISNPEMISEQSIINAFLMWKKSRIDGVLTILPGLVRRRKSEAHLYLTGELKFKF